MTDFDSATRLTDPLQVSLQPIQQPTVADRCPVRHSPEPEAAVEACPFRPEQATKTRSQADQFVRRLLFVRERDASVSASAAESAFQKSMLISAARCTLTYVVFPFVLPAMGVVTSVGPLLGVIIGVLALVCDVFSIRRFFAADHRYRWHFTVLALCVMGLLTVLLVQDIAAQFN
jgi:uncharacterized membrane protein